MTLTDEEVEEIVAALHEHMQFYDERGQKNNKAVLGDVAQVLRDMLGEED